MLLDVSVEEHSSGLVLHSVVYPNRLGDLWTEDYMLIKTHSLHQLCIGQLSKANAMFAFTWWTWCFSKGVFSGRAGSRPKANTHRQR